MSLRAMDGEARFSGYVEGLVSVIGHADRARPLWDYCLGLVLPCERKSVEPIAAVTAPQRTAAQHQSLLQLRLGLPEGSLGGDRGDPIRLGNDVFLRTSQAAPISMVLLSG